MLALVTNLPKAYLSAQLGQGVVVMVLGMLVVFFFLVILIGAIMLMGKVLAKYAKPEAPKKNVTAAAPVAKAANDDGMIAAAIAAAVDKAR